MSGLVNFLFYWLTVYPRLTSLRKLLPDADIYPFGSRYVCSPPVLFTDVDFMIYSETDVLTELIHAGYEGTDWWRRYFGDIDPDDSFRSLRKGVINVVLTTSKVFHERNRVATHICRRFNVRSKFFRVVIYESVRNLNTEMMKELEGFNPEVKALLVSFASMHGQAIFEAYRQKYNLRGSK